MRLLLDTHVMVWWLRDNPLLGSRAKAAIANQNADLLVSVASFWELSIKYKLGKIAETGTLMHREAVTGGLVVVGVTTDHLAALEGLAFQPQHKDPFDHLILAQALAEDAILVTNDSRMLEYDVRSIRAG